MTATKELEFDKNHRCLYFSARFNGVESYVVIPFRNITGYCTKEVKDLWIPKLNFSRHVEEEKKKPDLKVVAYNPEIKSQKSKADLKIVKG